MKFICLIMNYGKRMKINHYDICDGFKSFHDEDHFLLQLLETKNNTKETTEIEARYYC